MRYVPVYYKTLEMYDKGILENCGTLKYVSDCYKNYEMCNKAVDNSTHALLKTRKMCKKAANISPSAI